MIQFFFDRVVKVYRQKTTSGNKMAYVATATGEAHIQRLQQDPSEIQPGVYSQLFKIWVPLDVSVQEGDRCRDEHGVEYTVIGVTDSFFGSTQYREVIVQQTDGPND